MSETAVCREIATMYAQFPWLEKIYPQAEADRACVGKFKDVGTVSNASAYLAHADGTFSEIALTVVCRHLWPGAFLSDSTTVENLGEDVRCANQAVLAPYAVLIQHTDRSVTIFEL